MSFDFTRSKKNSYSLVHTSILSHSCPICGPVTKRSSLHFVCLTWLWIWIRVKWIERNEHLFIVLIWSISFKFSYSYAAFISIVMISSILLYQWSSNLKHTHCSHNIWSFNNVESSIFTADKCERQSAHNEPSYSCVHTLARASHNVYARQLSQLWCAHWTMRTHRNFSSFELYFQKYKTKHKKRHLPIFNNTFCI